MDSRYDKSARALAEQKKRRMRVIRRRKVAQTLMTGVVIIAISVGMAYMFVKGFEKEAQIYDQQMAEYRAEMGLPRITEEEMEEAKKEYYESHYSSETIGDLKSLIISEYGTLIDAIVENEASKGKNVDIKPLDEKRLDETIADYGNFKRECEEDKTDYTVASEEDRLNKSNALYNQRKKIIKDQIVEAEQKGKYLVQGSQEFLQNEEEIKDLNRKINSIDEALSITMDRSLTIYIDKQRAEEGRQR